MERKAIKISEKQIKIVAVITIVIIVVSILLWGMIPEKIYDVSEILNNPEGFDSKKVNVIGVVEEWEPSTYNFTLIDTMNKNLAINITHTGAFPEGFGDNKTVVVIGVFSLEARLIESQRIQIGCPSKY